MITPVWGKSYVDRWLGFSFAALRSRGNIPYLNEHADFELAIVTRSVDAEYMQSLDRFHRLTAGLRVRFVMIDELFPRTGGTSYGVPLTLAYAKAIRDLGESAVGTFVVVMNADCVVASGSLRGLLNKIRQGITVISAQSVRTIDGRARAKLLGNLHDDVLTVEPRELMRIASAHLHSAVSARIINERTIVDTTHYNQIYWRISNGCLAMRAFFLHPMCFRIDQAMPNVLCPVDYGFLTELCPDGRYGVMEDSDDFLILELQERDSEAYLLRVAPQARTLEQWLSRLSGEISRQASTWTTGEHRRCATKTLYYHEDDLPEDLPERVRPFEDFIDGILARMPPALSHVAHPHWLPAVRIYREDLRRGGADRVTALLDDPRNG